MGERGRGRRNSCIIAVCVAGETRATQFDPRQKKDVRKNNFCIWSTFATTFATTFRMFLLSC